GITNAPVSAQVKPGDFITPDNSYKVKDLLSPGAYMRVEHGMSIKVEPTERIDWPQPYTEATEKYSSQTRLTPDHRSLIGYVAGQPFPVIDANDPQAAEKVMWNEVFRPISTDDYDLRWFDCDSVYWGYNKPYFSINVTGRMYEALLYPVLAPATSRGVGLLKFRYASPSRDDDTWTWEAGSRRLRRLSYSLSDSATGAQAYDPNHYEGWSGK